MNVIFLERKVQGEAVTFTNSQPWSTTSQYVTNNTSASAVDSCHWWWDCLFTTTGDSLSPRAQDRPSQMRTSRQKPMHGWLCVRDSSIYLHSPNPMMKVLVSMRWMRNRNHQHRQQSTDRL